MADLTGREFGFDDNFGVDREFGFDHTFGCDSNSGTITVSCLHPRQLNGRLFLMLVLWACD